MTHFSLVEDDAFIHMRIARNLWHFGAPYFNPDERIMASTAPLWIIVTSLLASSGSLLPLLVSVINCLITIYCAALSALLCKKLLPHAEPLFALLAGVSVWCAVIPSSVALMETPLTIVDSQPASTAAILCWAARIGPRGNFSLRSKAKIPFSS